MKKFLCTLLALLLCASPMAAMAKTASNVYLDDIWPVVTDKMSVTIAVVPQNPGEYDTDNMWITQYWDSVTNLDIEWQVIDNSAANERIPLMMAGGTMPDALMGWYWMDNNYLVQWGMDEGLLYPIDELLAYMPAFSALLEKDDTLRQAVYAPDGHIYGMPNLATRTDMTTRFFMPATWLKNVGKEMPTTLDELYDVLCAFRDQDANGNGDASDEIPFCTPWNGDYRPRGWILNAFGFSTTYENDALRYNDDGTAEPVYIPYTEEYKAFLKYMNKLWSEGLLDPDMFTQDQNQANAKLTEGVAGFVSNAGVSSVAPELSEDYDFAVPLTSEYSATPIYPEMRPIVHPGLFVINRDCDLETAAALANFIDACYTIDMSGLYADGPTYVEGELPEPTKYGQFYSNEYGKYWDAENNKTVEVYDKNTWSSGWVWRTTQVSFWAIPGHSCNGNDDWKNEFSLKYPDTLIGQQYAAKREGKVVDSHQTVTFKANALPYAKPQLPSFYFEVEDLNKYNELIVLLDDYVSGMEAKFITGEISIDDEWDTFTQTLEEYGVEEFVSILDQYYDLYASK